MKLLVIVISLLCERFLTHAISKNRFDWFPNYFEKLGLKLPPKLSGSNPFVLLALVIIPILLGVWLILAIFDNLIFGLIAFILNLAIFYYCLGPNNPFYPVRENLDENHSEEEVKHYFFKVCGELFAPVFWYILAGPVVVLAYRLISLCQKENGVGEIAKKLTDLLDWIPARLTTLLYLLVGNFQPGFNFFLNQFLTSPSNNQVLLEEGGIQAAKVEGSQIQMPYAEGLVEHAITVFLVFIALLTLVAWL